MAGLADFLLGAKNPFTLWANDHSNFLAALGAGLGQGQNIQAGLSAGLAQMPQALQLDNKAFEQQKADAKVAAQTNAFGAWLKGKRPDLVPLLDAGVSPAELFNQAMAPAGGGDGFTLGTGQIRYDANGKPIAQGPAATPEVQPGMMPGPNGTQVPVPGGKEAFDRSDALWKEYQAAEPVKSYQMVRNGYEKLRSASQLNNGAGDVSMIFAYMKMLDPTSVVREGEFATAEQTGGIPSQISNLYNKLLNGERLTPEQRQQFVQAGDGLYQETVKNLSQANDQYGGRAKNWGVDPSSIVMTPETYSPLTFGVPKTKTIGGKTFVQDANGDWYQQ